MSTLVRHIPLVMFAVLLAACSRPSIEDKTTDESAGVHAVDGQFRNVHLKDGFVGDVACFDCHEEQYSGFQEHGMAQSFYPLTPETEVEAFGSEVVVDSARGYRYRTFKTGEGYFMEEYLVDVNGDKNHSLIREMEYVVGSGTIARTYLTEEAGWFYELPITWYTGSGKWDFSPGYDENSARFDRKIADRCMVCHNSYPEPVPQTDGAYVEVPFGIGCERCHGPGQLHVDERLASPEPAGDVDDSIVNPAHLSLDRQLDVCQQCHLNSTVSLLRSDRTAYDYRPSQDLSDYIVLFDTHESSSEGAIGVISHADRMKQSACFTESLSALQPLQCTTCHDPHEGFKDKGPDYFNTTCQSCHSPAQLEEQFRGTPAAPTHVADANCIACHMPKADLEEAPHSAFTDHWIRVVSDTGTPRPIRTTESDELRPYFSRDASGRGIMYQGMAYVTLGRQQGSESLLRKGIALLEKAERDGYVSGEATYLRGFGLQILGQHEQSVAPLEAAVLDAPDRAERLNALAQAYERTGRDPVKTEQLYRRALQIQPKLASIRINLGRFLESRGRLDAAMAEYEQAMMDEPWNLLAVFNLGTAYLQKGDTRAAEQYLTQALKLDPRYVDAWSNLGFTYAGTGDMDRAKTAFERGVAINPTHFEALDNLGTFYLNAEDEANAVVLFERALAVRPRAVGTRAKLALAWFRMGDMIQARTAATKALDDDPSNELARQILDAL